MERRNHRITSADAWAVLLSAIGGEQVVLTSAEHFAWLLRTWVERHGT